MYLIGGATDYAFMVLLFVFWIAFLVDMNPSKSLLVFVTCFYLLLIIFYIFNNDNLFDLGYGRPRILLGFFHPKEAALALFSIFFLYFFIKMRLVFFVWVALLVILYLIGSRGTLIGALSLGLGYAVYGNRVALFSILHGVLSLIFVSFIALSYDDIFSYFDKYSSYRLSHWSNLLNYGPSPDRVFGYDNFYLEAYSVVGPFGPILVILILLYYMYCSWIANSKHGRISFSGLCFISVSSIFDSGLITTGSFICTLTWALAARMASQSNISRFNRRVAT